MSDAASLPSGRGIDRHVQRMQPGHGNTTMQVQEQLPPSENNKESTRTTSQWGMDECKLMQGKGVCVKH
jgi:hypothetical protein